MIFPGGDSSGLSNAMLEEQGSCVKAQVSGGWPCALVKNQKKAGSAFLVAVTASSRLPQDVGVGRQQSRLNGALGVSSWKL